MDDDETLIRLWDAGLSAISSPQHLLRGHVLDAARHSVGLASHRELGSMDYWMKKLQIGESELRGLLVGAVDSNPSKRSRLTKQQIGHLRRYGARPSTAVADGLAAIASTANVPATQLEWLTLGRLADVRLLTTDKVINIHEELARDYSASSDPVNPTGVRSGQLLESAVSRTATALGLQWKYPTIEMASAALLVGLVHNHAFHNGNKRTALVAMLVTLDLNGLILECSDDELFKLVLQLSQHSLVETSGALLVDAESQVVAKWLCDRTRYVETGDRPISWRRLRQILSHFGCECLLVGNGPAHYVVTRAVTTRGSLFHRRPTTRSLQSSIQVIDDGRDLRKNTLKKIRTDLELDEGHGVDSVTFYGFGSRLPSDFINKYRKLLVRLSRV